MELNQLTEAIIGAAIEVHRILGPELPESSYVMCLCRELAPRGIAFEKERSLPVSYKGTLLDGGYRTDIIVEGRILLEHKSVANIEAIHEAQLLTYTRLGGWKAGLILNFNVPVLKDGIQRRVLGLRE